MTMFDLRVGNHEFKNCLYKVTLNWAVNWNQQEPTVEKKKKTCNGKAYILWRLQPWESGPIKITLNSAQEMKLVNNKYHSFVK